MGGASWGLVALTCNYRGKQFITRRREVWPQLPLFQGCVMRPRHTTLHYYFLLLFDFFVFMTLKPNKPELFATF